MRVRMRNVTRTRPPGIVNKFPLDFPENPGLNQLIQPKYIPWSVGQMFRHKKITRPKIFFLVIFRIIPTKMCLVTSLTYRPSALNMAAGRHHADPNTLNSKPLTLIVADQRGSELDDGILSTAKVF